MTKTWLMKKRLRVLDWTTWDLAPLVFDTKMQQQTCTTASLKAFLLDKWYKWTIEILCNFPLFPDISSHCFLTCICILFCPGLVHRSVVQIDDASSGGSVILTALWLMRTFPGKAHLASFSPFHLFFTSFSSFLSLFFYFTPHSSLSSFLICFFPQLWTID